MGTAQHPLKVGLELPMGEKSPHSSARWSDIRDFAVAAEAVGFDSLWVTDHFLYQLEGDSPPLGKWEAWSVLSALAVCTESVELGTLVLGMGFRNPALLAKMADTLEEISGGRLILGLGAGYHDLEYRAFGYPADHRYSRFAEAIEIVHGLLRHGEIDFEGRYYSARDCLLRPRGPRPEGPPILIGSSGPKMLRLVARYADAWNAYWDDTRNSPAGLPALRARVDEACAEVGRDAATLERTATVLAAEADADPWWNDLPTGHEGLAVKPLCGTPEEIAAELKAYHRQGITHLQISMDALSTRKIEAFAPALERLRAMA